MRQISEVVDRRQRNLKRQGYSIVNLVAIVPLFMNALVNTLAHCLWGEFDNREQAIADPVWFVHLKAWHRPVNLFTQDSLTVFAEQANVLQLDQAYRQRLLRIQSSEDDPQFPLKVQYYRFKEPSAFRGAGQHPELLENITEDCVEVLPGCILQVMHIQVLQGSHFKALPPADVCCYFPYQDGIRQVSLGFEATSEKFFSYDKGIDIDTGKALWGAILGAYEYTKRKSY